MTQTTFSVSARTIFGKKTKQLRQLRQVPGSVYGQGESVSVQLSQPDFDKLYDQMGETGLIYLQIEGESKTRPVLIDEVQVDPVSNVLNHVAFKQVNLSEKITAQIPLRMEGEANVPGGTLVTVMDTVTVEALPANLPENFVVDLSKLTEIGQAITMADLVFDKSKIEIVLEGEMTLEDQPLIIMQEQKEEEEGVTAEDAVVAEVEVIGEKKDEAEETTAS